MSKNSNRVSVDNLSKEIMKMLTEYKEDINEEVESLSKKYVKKACAELKSISPVSKEKVQLKKYSDGTREYQFPGSYASDWSTKQKEKSTNKYSRVAYNKGYYRLTHLLEFGHATRNGGRTRAIPHIRPIEDKYNVKFVDKLEKRIREDSKWH